MTSNTQKIDSADFAEIAELVKWHMANGIALPGVLTLKSGKQITVHSGGLTGG